MSLKTMKKNSILVLLVLVSLFTSRSFSQTPKLIVVLSYDQMRGDYIERYRSILSKNGFLQIADGGSYYTDCHYTHASNVTCAGHAVLMTGCNPWKSGIVSNDFFDQETGCACYCTEEPSSDPKHEHHLSPALLLTKTLGDYVREKKPDSKQVSIAIKDRAAILMAGKNAKHVLWMNDTTGDFETSSMYVKPLWLDKWQKENPASNYFGKTWSAVLPQNVSFADSIKQEGKMPGGDNVFPHEIPLKGENAVYAYACTPFAVSHLFQTGLAIINNEKMGKGKTTDILCLGISTTDLTGHLFGPDSRELQELYIHCDTILGNFIEKLDKGIGRNNYVLVVTSDHGVAPIPEIAKNQTPVGFDAGRISISKLKKELNEVLRKELNLEKEAEAVKTIYPPAITFNKTVLIDDRMYKTAFDKAMEFLHNYNGIGYVQSTENIIKGNNTEKWEHDLFDKIRNSTHPMRSGDIIFYPKMYWIYGSNPASHGTPYSYDTHVPLIFFGGSIKKQKLKIPVSPADIAPTLGKLVDIALPNVDGNILPIQQ